jgi:hypothetical protein
MRLKESHTIKHTNMNVIAGLDKILKTQQLGMQDHNNNQRKHLPLQPVRITLKQTQQPREEEGTIVEWKGRNITS